jgi:hypothetical protein
VIILGLNLQGSGEEGLLTGQVNMKEVNIISVESVVMQCLTL